MSVGFLRGRGGEVPPGQWVFQAQTSKGSSGRRAQGRGTRPGTHAVVEHRFHHPPMLQGRGPHLDLTPPHPPGEEEADAAAAGPEDEQQQSPEAGADAAREFQFLQPGQQQQAGDTQVGGPAGRVVWPACARRGHWFARALVAHDRGQCQNCARVALGRGPLSARGRSPMGLVPSPPLAISLCVQGQRQRSWPQPTRRRWHLRRRSRPRSWMRARGSSRCAGGDACAHPVGGQLWALLGALLWEGQTAVGGK